ncbi:MAG: D-alanyl-D-alanine carboxypeptidase [Deltaproteobacteria bacterium]|nr:D-alanyl-D-alanine carboxypeptidase [Deltaproteobacteria bacterium]
MLSTRHRFLSAALYTLCLLYAGPVQAAEPAPPFDVAAESVLLMNERSGRIICAKNPDLSIPPASLTKIMTLVVANDAIDNGYASLDDEVVISEKAWRTGGSKMFVAVNSRVPLRKLLEGIAIVSGNDACVAVAEHIAGVEDVFVEKMNRKAAEIGMNNTMFKNSHGLPDEQYTTVRDMAILADYYISHHPECLQIHSTKELTYNAITQRNRNGLLWLDSGFDGLKTGWFSTAGYHIVATAQQEQDRFIAVVMGAGTVRQREAVARQLITYGFRNFTTLEVLSAATPLAQASVWKGAQDHVALGPAAPVILTVERSSLDSIVVQNDFAESVQAPVAMGQEFGQARILLHDGLLASVPLVALHAVDRASLARCVLHTATLLFIRPPYWGALVLALLLIAACVARLASRTGASSRTRKKHGDNFL